MPELRRCVCGKDYWWPGARWQHDKCGDKGIPNPADEVLDEVQQRGKDAVAPIRASSGKEQAGVVKKQRWSRESYNAYQREYMRKRRASGG